MMMIEFILYVKDRIRSRDFYSALFEKQPLLDVPGMTEFKLDANLKLGLMPEENIARIICPPMEHPSDANGVPRCELYFYVDNPNTFLERAIFNGAKLVDEVNERDWGDLAGYVADPDGHILVFAKRIKP